MRFLPLLCATAFLAPFAKADKFWLSDPAAETVAGSKADLIEGVLLDQDDNHFHIRVVGGEIMLPKSRVFRHDKDGLDLDAIAKGEDAEQKRMARINDGLRMARAAARLQDSVNAAEAAATKQNVQAAEASMPRSRPTPSFNPVLGTATSGMSQQDLLQELQLAWTLTKDRRYLKALRQMRRLR